MRWRFPGDKLILAPASETRRGDNERRWRFRRVAEMRWRLPSKKLILVPVPVPECDDDAPALTWCPSV
eukprot:15464620-Alexandrium_andersonii.AAC.1